MHEKQEIEIRITTDSEKYFYYQHWNCIIAQKQIRKSLLSNTVHFTQMKVSYDKLLLLKEILVIFIPLAIFCNNASYSAIEMHEKKLENS